jgi:hypothetical protein
LMRRRYQPSETPQSRLATAVNASSSSMRMVHPITEGGVYDRVHLHVRSIIPALRCRSKGRCTCKRQPSWEARHVSGVDPSVRADRGLCRRRQKISEFDNLHYPQFTPRITPVVRRRAATDGSNGSPCGHNMPTRGDRAAAVGREATGLGREAMFAGQTGRSPRSCGRNLAA